MYYDYVSKPFILYVVYLELLYQIIFNSVIEKNKPEVLRDFEVIIFQGFQPKKICDEKIKIASLVIKETAFLCLEIIDSNNSWIDAGFIRYVFESYKKGIHYLSPSLEIDNNL